MTAVDRAAVDTCARCGRPFPRTGGDDDDRPDCEPCRAARWRDDRAAADEAGATT